MTHATRNSQGHAGPRIQGDKDTRRLVFITKDQRRVYDPLLALTDNGRRPFVGRLVIEGMIPGRVGKVVRALSEKGVITSRLVNEADPRDGRVIRILKLAHLVRTGDGQEVRMAQLRQMKAQKKSDIDIAAALGMRFHVVAVAERPEPDPFEIALKGQTFEDMEVTDDELHKVRRQHRRQGQPAAGIGRDDPQTPLLSVVRSPFHDARDIGRGAERDAASVHADSEASAVDRGRPCLPLGDRTEREGCRYPIGEPGARDFRWCDAPRQHRSPYCAKHHSACWVAAAPKTQIVRPKVSAFMLRGG